jgi:hypothetical protein
VRTRTGVPASIVTLARARLPACAARQQCHNVEQTNRPLHLASVAGMDQLRRVGDRLSVRIGIAEHPLEIAR